MIPSETVGFLLSDEGHGKWFITTYCVILVSCYNMTLWPNYSSVFTVMLWHDTNIIRYVKPNTMDDKGLNVSDVGKAKPQD